jgi:antitoxin FitA
MATLTIKNLPDSLYESLKRTASKHRRSINSEVIVQLENSLGNANANASQLLKEIRESREKLPILNLTDEFLEYAKNEGRP